MAKIYIKIPVYFMIISAFLFLIEFFTTNKDSSGSIGVIVSLINGIFPCSYPLDTINSMPCEYKYAIPYILSLIVIFILSCLSIGIILLFRNKRQKNKV